MGADAARENGVRDPDGVVDHVVGGPRELLDLLGEAVE
jgi:hypothetical protein